MVLCTGGTPPQMPLLAPFFLKLPPTLTMPQSIPSSFPFSESCSVQAKTQTHLVMHLQLPHTKSSSPLHPKSNAGLWESTNQPACAVSLQLSQCYVSFQASVRHLQQANTHLHSGITAVPCKSPSHSISLHQHSCAWNDEDCQSLQEQSRRAESYQPAAPETPALLSQLPTNHCYR